MKKKTRSRLVNSNVLFGPPPILAGEEETAYDELIGRVYAAIKPVDVIDEMLIADVVASEWEFLRWSRLKLSLLQACATKGLKDFSTANWITSYTGNVLWRILRKSSRTIFRKTRPKTVRRGWPVIVR